MVVVIYLCYSFKRKPNLDFYKEDSSYDYPLQCAVGYPSQLVYFEALLVVLGFTD